MKLSGLMGFLLLGMFLSIPAAQAEDWNDAQIHWLSFHDGMGVARAQNKPVCLVFYTDWCPHCRNYGHVFSDPKVVAASKKFVMVRVNSDHDPDLSRRLAPDGEYIPRTLFLSSNGELAREVHAPRSKASFFYDEFRPDSLLHGMARAAKVLHASDASARHPGKSAPPGELFIQVTKPSKAR